MGSHCHRCLCLQEDVILREMARKRAASGPKAAPEPKVDHLGRAHAVGGRKTSTAQVRLWNMGRSACNTAAAVAAASYKAGFLSSVCTSASFQQLLSATPVLMCTAAKLRGTQLLVRCGVVLSACL
jgi:hypothetical protein